MSTQLDIEKYPPPQRANFKLHASSTQDATAIYIEATDAPHKHIPPPRFLDASNSRSIKSNIVDHYELANERNVNDWKRKIGKFLAKEVLNPYGIKTAKPSACVLGEFPPGYRLYVHKKGTKAAPRTDHYLLGSKHVHQFRSPNEFTFHALWLMCGMPCNADGTPNCFCQYCNGTPQDVISENFSNYHRPKRPTEHTATMDPATINRRAVRTAGVVKRKAPTKRSAADPPIKFKDYTQKT